jgi:hypothetical protein
MWYVEIPFKICNAGDRTFYDAINVHHYIYRDIWSSKTICLFHSEQMEVYNADKISIDANFERDGKILAQNEERQVLQNHIFWGQRVNFSLALY